MDKSTEEVNKPLRSKRRDRLDAPSMSRQQPSRKGLEPTRSRRPLPIARARLNVSKVPTPSHPVPNGVGNHTNRVSYSVEGPNDWSTQSLDF